MLYLSRGEQVALVLLLGLLLAGGGVLTYRRGLARGQAQAESPLFVEAPASRAAVPTVTPPPAAPRPATSRAAATDLISLNTATLEQLDTLPGIGPVYAQRIIDHREELRRTRGHGYRSVDELLDVAGIGPKRLAQIRDKVRP